MTELSPRLALPLLQAGQAQKELFHNEALIRLDAVVHVSVASIATDTPPSSPSPGECWIVGASPSGNWTGHATRLAMWSEGGWRFVAPVVGMQAWLKDRGVRAWYDGSAWQAGPLPTDGVAVGGTRVVGMQRPAIAEPAGGGTVDGEARATLAAVLVALRDHGLIAT